MDYVNQWITLINQDPVVIIFGVLGLLFMLTCLLGPLLEYLIRRK